MVCLFLSLVGTCLKRGRTLTSEMLEKALLHLFVKKFSVNNIRIIDSFTIQFTPVPQG